MSASPEDAAPVIRIYAAGDHEAIGWVFSEAVHEIASSCYTQEQCDAWADREPDLAYWKNRCELKRPFVVTSEGEIAGFLELDPDGHIDCAYIHPRFQRRGMMSLLVAHAIECCAAMGIPRMTVDASHCAKPLFEKMGFHVIRENAVVRKGVTLTNFTMEYPAPTVSQTTPQ